MGFQGYHWDILKLEMFHSIPGIYLCMVVLYSICSPTYGGDSGDDVTLCSLVNILFMFCHLQDGAPILMTEKVMNLVLSFMIY